VRPFLIILLCVYVTSLHADRYDERYIGCDLADLSRRNYRHLFVFDVKRETLFHLITRQAFNVTANKASELRASNSVSFREFSYHRADFFFDPLSGTSKMLYLRKPAAAECKREQIADCENALLLMQERMEQGNCKMLFRSKDYIDDPSEWVATGKRVEPRW
jgi:hypothetical protein